MIIRHNISNERYLTANLVKNVRKINIKTMSIIYKTIF